MPFPDTHNLHSIKLLLLLLLLLLNTDVIAAGTLLRLKPDMACTSTECCSQGLCRGSSEHA
jgi:hypothetical protein